MSDKRILARPTKALRRLSKALEGSRRYADDMLVGSSMGLRNWSWFTPNIYCPSKIRKNIAGNFNNVAQMCRLWSAQSPQGEGKHS